MAWRVRNPDKLIFSFINDGTGRIPGAAPPWPGCCENGVGRILIPSSTEVAFEIFAKGYKPWPPTAVPGLRHEDWKEILKYPPPKEGRLNLAPGEVYKLNVKLEPVR
jgi:hypothetical protein